MSYTLQNPFISFVDANKPKPVGLGKLFVGLPDTDPELSPVNVYAVQPDGSELLLSQPITLTAGGVASFNGNPVQLRIDAETVSIKVEYASGEQSYYTARWSSPVQVSDLSPEDSTVIVGGISANEIKKSGIAASTAEIATGKFPVGSYLNVTDRAMAPYIVRDSGTVDGKAVINAGTGKYAHLDMSALNELNPEFIGATVEPTDITEYVQYLVNMVGVQDPFDDTTKGVTIKFTAENAYNIFGTVLIPSYVRIDLNGCTLGGNGSNVMFETAYWNGGVLVSNFGQPSETRFVVNSQITNGRISNCRAFRLYNFCESSLVENIRFFGCNQVVYALRCFYGSFKQLHARTPVDGSLFPCFHFESAMGALEAAQVYANGYQRGILVSGNKDNMQISNFSAETCPTGLSIENATSGITIERGYFENNFNAISLSTLANHQNVTVENCWFLSVTNALEATTAISGVWRQSNIMNGTTLSLQDNFGCRMTVEIPTDMSPNNATYGLPSNYLLGRANNVEYIKQVYDSVTGLVEAKGNVYCGPIPRNYAGTSGKLIANQIPFCTTVFTSTSLTVDTKIEYQPQEFVSVYIVVDGVAVGGIFANGEQISSIASLLSITASDVGGFFRFVVTGFFGGAAFSGSIKIL